jgi:hypothetical protein
VRGGLLSVGRGSAKAAAENGLDGTAGRQANLFKKSRSWAIYYSCSWEREIKRVSGGGGELKQNTGWKSGTVKYSWACVCFFRSLSRKNKVTRTADKYTP